MRHLNEATLALHAGGDLGSFARWRAERHLTQCEQCRAELAAFAAAREITSELAEIPELPWNRLAAEMKANIRLGLAAGECVRDNAAPLRDHHWFRGARAAVACASVVALLAAGLVLERPHPSVTADNAVTLENTPDGIQMSDGVQALSLRNPLELRTGGAQSVIYSVNSQGRIGARYVDPRTGLMTINNLDLYAQ
jgi:hypothetical protein